MASGRFVSYLRVSTKRQGQSGLGLEAQRETIAKFLNGGNWDLISEVVEIESGKKNNRPKLAEAIALCRAYGATLVIAKLDRLSRDAAFLLNLRDGDIEFIVADMPEANRMTVGMMALVAEYEREQISGRVKAALAAAKARGTQLGAYRDGVFVGRIGNAQNMEIARAARVVKADRVAGNIRFILDRIDPEGTMSLSEMSRKLNEERVPTPSGKGKWAATTVKRLRERLEAAA